MKKNRYSSIGPRERGRPKTRFIDEITKPCGGFHAMVQQAKDRRGWRRFVKEATAILTSTSVVYSALVGKAIHLITR